MQAESKKHSHHRRGRAVLFGAGSNTIRLLATSAIAIVLPPLLTRALSRDQYSTWVLLLQLSSYVGLLDLGLQTTVAKFVASHQAREQYISAVQTVRTARRILLICAGLATIVLVIAAQFLDALFPQVPGDLRKDMASALLILGVSVVLTLPFGPYLAAFTGLQLYVYPAALTIIVKAAQVLALGATGLITHSLVAMAVSYAAINVLLVWAQFVGWRRLVWPRLQRARGRFDGPTARALLSSGLLISLWLLGGVIVSSIDIVLVGRFDLPSSGAYALAAAIVSILVGVIGGLFSPLMPLTAAVTGPGAPRRVARLVVRSSTVSTLVICALCVTMVAFAYPLLDWWVGKEYADRGAPVLSVLIVANSIRQLLYVYSLAVIARGQQRYATVATLSEAVVNFGVSIWLGQAMGAIGVALGTAMGAIVSVSLHLLLSMRGTYTSIPIHRWTFIWRSIAKPLICYLPAVVAVVGFHVFDVAFPVLVLPFVVALAMSLLFAWLTALEADQRNAISARVRSRLRMVRTRVAAPGTR